MTARTLALPVLVAPIAISSSAHLCR